MKKRAMGILLACAMVASSTALGSVAVSAESEGGVTGSITIYTNTTGVQTDLLQELTDEWEAENPGASAEIIAPGADYESIMKVKMASKDMPDVFATHGWSKARYADFLLGLNDMEWADQIDPSFREMISDDEGNLLVLPMDQAKAGMIYNKDVIEEYGIEMPVNTVEEMMDAMEKIKTESNGEVSPIHIAGGDVWPLGNVFNALANPAFVAREDNQTESLLDGSFDWDQWTDFVTIIKEFYDNGYFNTDCFTAKYTDSAQAFAEGKVAFCFYQPPFVEEARAINPDVQAGMQPYPAINGGDLSYVNGEQTAFGIWKESENVETAKSWLNFMARSESINAMCLSNLLMPGVELEDAVDLGFVSECFELYPDYEGYPIFDRECLPSGMWDLICTDGADLFTGAITPEDFSKDMSNEYNRLLEAAAEE